MKKNSGLKDVKKNLLSDIVAVWKKAGVPLISIQRVETKLKDLIDMYHAARKNEIHRGKKIHEKWMRELFDICRCIIAERPKISRKKLQCICEYKNRMPEKEILFIKDQREGRQMYMSNIDIPHERNKVEKATHRRKTDDELPSSSVRNHSNRKMTMHLRWLRS